MSDLLRHSQSTAATLGGSIQTLRVELDRLQAALEKIDEADSSKLLKARRNLAAKQREFDELTQRKSVVDDLRRQLADVLAERVAEDAEVQRLTEELRTLDVGDPRVIDVRHHLADARKRASAVKLASLRLESELTTITQEENK